MENKKSSLIPNILAITFLATLVIGTYVHGARYYSNPLPPQTVHDFSREFNEKRYWLEHDKASNKMYINSQRIGLYPEFYRSAHIYSVPGEKLTGLTPIFEPKTECWFAEGAVLCKTPINDLRFFARAKKVKKGQKTPGLLLGNIKNYMIVDTSETGKKKATENKKIK